MGTVSVFHMIRVEEAYVLNTGKYLFITYTQQNFNILLIRRGKNGTLFAVDVFRLCWYVTVIQLIAFDEGERLLLESLFPRGIYTVPRVSLWMPYDLTVWTSSWLTGWLPHIASISLFSRQGTGIYFAPRSFTSDETLAS